MRFALLPIAFLVLGLSLGGWAEETEKEVLARTDLSNPDSVYALAMWYKDHGFPLKSRQQLQRIIKELDKDHEAARAALGFVRVGDRWKYVAPGSAGPSGPTPQDAASPSGPTPTPVAPRSAGPGPAADKIPWDLTVPKDPDPGNAFFTARLNAIKDARPDSPAMDAAIGALWPVERGAPIGQEHETQVASGISRLCAAMKDPSFTDVYAGSILALNLIRTDRMPQARQLLPFLAVASARARHPEALATFCQACAAFKDKRTVPRLIELLSHANEEVRDAATQALATICLLPAEKVTPERIKEWWNANHALTDEQILRAQLNNPDPLIRIEAASGLLAYREKTIIPVLIACLRHADRQVRRRAIEVLAQALENDWNFDPNMPEAERKKRIEMIERWWKEEGPSFRFRDRTPAAPAAAEAQRDPAEGWVADLASVQGATAEKAEANLRAKGPAAVPALIAGLENPNLIVRRKCIELLRLVAKKDLAFDARADEAARAKDIAAIRAWAVEAKLLSPPGEGEEEGK